MFHKPFIALHNFRVFFKMADTFHDSLAWLTKTPSIHSDSTPATVQIHQFCVQKFYVPELLSELDCWARSAYSRFCT